MGFSTKVLVPGTGCARREISSRGRFTPAHSNEHEGQPVGAGFTPAQY